MKKLLLMVVLVIFGSTNLFSETSLTGIDKTELKTYSEKIVKLIEKGSLDKAFAEVRKIWPIPEAEISLLETQTVKQLDIVKSRFGKSLGIVLIKEKEVADIIYKLVYVIKYEHHITRWIFTFYKPGDKWVLNTFKWDDNIESLF